MSRYSMSLITPPTGLPLEVGALKDWLRVDTDTDDPLIRDLIAEATDAAERLINRQMLTATWRMGLPRFPRGDLLMPRSPLQSVASVLYIDLGGVQRTLDPSFYVVDPFSDPGTISLAWSKYWPATFSIPNAVVVTFTAGYLTPQLIPPGILRAIKLSIANGYENRGDAGRVLGAGRTEQTGALSDAAERLLLLYRSGVWEHGEEGTCLSA